MIILEALGIENQIGPQCVKKETTRSTLAGTMDVST